MLIVMAISVLWTSVIVFRRLALVTTIQTKSARKRIGQEAPNLSDTAHLTAQSHDLARHWRLWYRCCWRNICDWPTAEHALCDRRKPGEPVSIVMMICLSPATIDLLAISYLISAIVLDGETVAERGWFVATCGLLGQRAGRGRPRLAKHRRLIMMDSFLSIDNTTAITDGCALRDRGLRNVYSHFGVRLNT